MKKTLLILFLVLLVKAHAAEDKVVESDNFPAEVEGMTDAPEKNTGKIEEASKTSIEEDHLESLKADIAPPLSELDKNAKSASNEKDSLEKPEKLEEPATSNFDIGDEEKKLLKLSKYVQKKLTSKEWDAIASKTKTEKYEIQKGDYLWSISKKLFGSGFFYSKIWALNPQIVNPHEIEPGTVLLFDMGDSLNLPQIQVNGFDSEKNAPTQKTAYSTGETEDGNQSPWLQERQKLINQGVYFQFASEETYEDLEKLERKQRNREYEKYDPPVTDITIREPSENYDSTGFDKSSKIIFGFKEGFFLNSFVTTNFLQDVGEIVHSQKESVFMHKNDIIYVKFNKNLTVRVGDLFTSYINGGVVKNPVSDRHGTLYTTTAQLKVLHKKDDLFECQVVEQSGLVQRGDHVTTHTPRIGKILKSYAKRKIEAAIIGSYRDTILGITFGDVVYLDRGRADGVELGNIFDVTSSIDRGTEKRITKSPTYKIGELTIISLTENFATAIVTHASSELFVGSLAETKSAEEAAIEVKLKKLGKDNIKTIEHKKTNGEVEINLDDINPDILKSADKIQLTDDELKELERQEKELSSIQTSDKDLMEVDRLESELKDAEGLLNEKKVDEDKLLEQLDLNSSELGRKGPNPNAFESLEDIEGEYGKKYLDEDLNNKENPYGLTENDLEEIDELLNTGPRKKL